MRNVIRSVALLAHYIKMILGTLRALTSDFRVFERIIPPFYVVLFS